MRAPPALGNPRRLGRVLEQVFIGVRRPASIARVLDLELRVVRSYLAHATWLGLAKDAPEPHLTSAGLAWVLAGNRRGLRMAEVARAHPVLGPVIRGPAEQALVVIGARLLEAGVQSTPALARRDARAILRLVTPHPAPPRPPVSVQLSLAFSGPIDSARPFIDADPGEDSLDAYAVVLRALLAEGELSLAGLRAVLDEAGATDAGLGGYAALALRRRDATRVGEQLVVTRGALARADLAESVVSIALSDPDFRAWLDGACASGEQGRCIRWARRLFAGAPVAEALGRLLLGRRVQSVPLAGDAGAPLPSSMGPFLDAALETPVAVAFPVSLTQLNGGIAWVHAAWRDRTRAPAAVRLPGPLDPRTLVHAGLFAPGEVRPRNIPDLLSLRLRALRAVPAFAVLAAAGLLHRRRRARLREREGDLWVEYSAKDAEPFSRWVQRLAQRRGWVLAKGPARPGWPALAQAAERLGILLRLRDLVTLDEALFMRLGADPDHREIHDRLVPFADLLDASRLREVDAP
jgi:hypothetical protein